MPEPQPSPTKSILSFWIKSLIFGLIILGMCLGYHNLRAGSIGLRIFNQALADAGMFLIALSMAMSGLTYFWDFLDKYLNYRKYLGLIGFWFIVVHGYISAFGLPQLFKFPGYYLETNNIIPFLFALGSFITLIVMAIISDRHIMVKIGGTLWRKILRFGYIAIIFGILHFGLKKYTSWTYWFQQEATLIPPLSLIVTIFAVWVIILRIALWWDLRKSN